MQEIPFKKSRNSYIERIKPFINQPLVKVLVGQRRVGKSYLLYHVKNFIRDMDSEANIIYLNMEDFNFRFI